MFGECHAHLIMDGRNYKAAVALHEAGPADAPIREHLQAYKDAGICFVREGGDHRQVSLRAKALAPEYGIDYRTPVFAIHKRHHYGGIVGPYFDDMAGYHALVKRAIEEDADFIKIMISGIMDFDTFGSMSEDGLSDEEIGEMIHIAHEEGCSVMAHANGDRIVSAAVRAGVDSVEHGYYLKEETLHQLAESSSLWIPTLAPVGNLIGCGRFPDEVVQRILKLQLENVALAADLGAKIGLGSDAGAYMVPHGQGILDEYQYMHKAITDKARLDAMLEKTETEIKKRFQRI